MTQHANEHDFRQWERDVLDIHHNTLQLWGISPSLAVYGLLAIHDCLLLCEYYAASVTGGKATEIPNRFALTLKRSENGLAQGLRWLVPELHDNPVTSTDDMGLIEAAHQFMAFAQNYIDIADFHRMYSQGIAKIDVDVATKTVTFTAVPTHGAATPATSMINSLQLGMRRLSTLNSNPNIWNRLSSHLSNTRTAASSGRIILTHPQFDLTPEMVDLAIQIMPHDLRELDGTTQLPGFELATFDRVWAAMWCWSLAASNAYMQRCHSGIQQHTGMPTQICPRHQFIDALSRATGTLPNVVDAIVQRLTFGTGIKEPDVILQPLICTGDVVAWSPRIIMSSKSRRNLLKVFARSSAIDSNLVATAIAPLGEAMARRLEAKLKKYGYITAVSREIRDADLMGEVDVVGWRSNSPNQLLLIECKGMIPPDEINEVSTVAKEAKRASEQLDRCERILSGKGIASLPRQFAQFVSSQDRRFAKMIVFYEGTPDNSYSHSRIPAIDLRSFLDNFRSRDFNDPESLIAAGLASALVENIKVVDHVYEDMKVGDVTYRLPMAVMEEEKSLTPPLEGLDAI